MAKHQKERNAEIYDRWDSGETKAALSRYYGVSNSRIHGIISREGSRRRRREQMRQIEAARIDGLDAFVVGRLDQDAQRVLIDRRICPVCTKRIDAFRADYRWRLCRGGHVFVSDPSDLPEGAGYYGA